ncbi:TPA: PepSY domain-containing protein [Enterococcus faecium]
MKKSFISMSILLGSTFLISQSNVYAADSLNDCKISLSEAIKTYKKHHPGTAITDIELDQSYGKWFYEFEGIDNTKEYTTKINAQNGKISKEKKEFLDYEDQREDNLKDSQLNLENMISLPKLKAIVLSENKGFRIEKYKISKRHQKTYIELSLRKNMLQKKEIKLDAQTGKILEIKNDD